ncbi:MAG: hypothetical protein A2W19_01180 [Spirochaetes bacterium RBG_16_49_21]|nr:MAG: hypothetical protein A2W19_01180 [Spirochaetes bacterium RBG_16_49_21]
MKPKLYLDTSIPSAYFDYSKPMRQLITQKWFELESVNYELYMSLIGIGEIEKLSNVTKKDNIKKLIFNNKIKILNFDDNVIKLSREYIEQGAIPGSEPEDAMHIAIATLNRIELLEIGSLEIYGGSKYGNL